MSIDLLKFEVTAPSIDALWDGLARDLNQLRPGDGLPGELLEIARSYFCCVLAGLPDGNLDGVLDAADGASDTLRFTIGDRLRSHLTLVAQDLYERFFTHSVSPCCGDAQPIMGCNGDETLAGVTVTGEGHSSDGGAA